MLLVLGATEFPLKYYFTKRPINGDKLLNWLVNYMMFPDLVYFCDAGILLKTIRKTMTIEVVISLNNTRHL